MAAPHDIEVTELLEQHLQGASPDLLRQMIASFANACRVPRAAPDLRDSLRVR